jgi:light-regulated signal transduction histidine kinase (bacteriophytochrome)
MNRELERSNSELDNFAYVASHHLKEPLRGLAINANYLSREDISDQGRKRIVRILKLCNRMEQLISDLLFFSRLWRGDDSHQSVDLKFLVSDVQNSLKETLEQRNGIIRITTKLPIVYAQQSKIKTVLHNLIFNGLKYNDADQKIIEIGYQHNARSNGAAPQAGFYVKDNGIGIFQNDPQKIFRIFSRLNTAKSYGASTGAGLFFVKKIVEGYGCEISYVSEKSIRTTFYFSLPLASEANEISTKTEKAT